MGGFAGRIRYFRLILSSFTTLSKNLILINGAAKKVAPGLNNLYWRALHQPDKPMRLLDLRSGWRRNTIALA